jgi:hypothetical protein
MTNYNPGNRCRFRRFPPQPGSRITMRNYLAKSQRVSYHSGTAGSRRAEATMPNITMLDIEELRETKLKPYIEKCLEHRAPDPGFHAMMGHNLDLCEAMFVAWDTVFNTGRVSHKLKEIIRVLLSRMASCTY